MTKQIGAFTWDERTVHSVGLSTNPPEDKQRAASFIEFQVSQWHYNANDVMSIIWCHHGSDDLYWCAFPPDSWLGPESLAKEKFYIGLLTPAPSQLSCPHDTDLTHKITTGAHFLASHKELDGTSYPAKIFLLLIKGYTIVTPLINNHWPTCHVITYDHTLMAMRCTLIMHVDCKLHVLGHDHPFSMYSPEVHISNRLIR